MREGAPATPRAGLVRARCCEDAPVGAGDREGRRAEDFLHRDVCDRCELPEHLAGLASRAAVNAERERVEDRLLVFRDLCVPPALLLVGGFFEVHRVAVLLGLAVA